MKVAIAFAFLALLGVAAALTHIPLKNVNESPELKNSRFGYLKKLVNGLFGSNRQHLHTKKAYKSAQEALNNYLDVQWYGPISVGTPAKVYQVLFDTGSSDFWLMGSNCYSLACYVHQTYNSAKSSSFKDQHTTFAIQYGSGSTSGNVAKETFTVAGLKCTDCFLGIGTTVSNDFYYSQFDGLAGMGWPALATIPNGVPFFFDLFKQGSAEENVFCFYLSKGQNQTGSTLVFGGVDLSFTSDKELLYTPLVSETYWLIGADSFSVKGSKSSSLNVIVDSGTSFIVGDSSFVNPILNAIGSNYDCANPQNSPTIEVVIGGKTLSIPPELYLLNIQGECTLAIEADDFPVELGFSVILGDVFMRQYYTCFDAGSKRIGFGLAK